MKRLVGLAVILILTLATLTVLAYATPPDQTWISGLYDNADYDEVIILATSTSSITGNSLERAFDVLRIVVELVSISATPSVTDPNVRLPVSRGPPIG
jgi:hypothetical protein